MDVKLSDNNSFTEEPFENHEFEKDGPLEDEFDSGLDFEGSPEKPADIPRIKSSSVNDLFGQFIADPSDLNTSLLLQDLHNFVLRIILKKSPNNPNAEDITQQAMLKIWYIRVCRACDKREFYCRCSSPMIDVLPNLKHPLFVLTSKFSNWVYRVVVNTLKDEWKKPAPKKEVEYFDWKNYHATGGRRISPPSHDKEDDTADSGGGTQALLTKDELHAAEDKLNNWIDGEPDVSPDELAMRAAIRKLPYQDQRLVSLLQDGCNDALLAKEFKCTKQQICNRWNRIQVLIKHELQIPAVKLHTCRVENQSLYVLSADRRYISDDDKSYKALPLKCACRKTFTRLESRKLIELAEAQHCFKTDKNGKPINDPSIIFAAQLPKTPRCGLTGRTHIEKAYIDDRRQNVDDIKIAAEMTLEMWRGLIAPGKDDPLTGRVVFTAFAEERTAGCFNDTGYEPAKPRTVDPATTISWDSHCPACQKDKLLVAVFPDGATRMDCSCGYLQVFSENVEIGASDGETNSFKVCETPHRVLLKRVI